MSFDKCFIGKILALGAAGLIHPIAWPGWLIEVIVRRWSPDWEFSVYSATPYSFGVLFFATLGLLSGNSLAIAAGMYVVAAMEMLGLWICLTVALGRAGSVRRWLNILGRRRKHIADGQVVLTSSAFYGGVVAYGVTAYFFACAAFFLDWAVPNSYAGLRGEHVAHRLWEFFYFSVVTIATLGYGDIAPVGVAAQLLVVLEVALGIFFVVFLFGTFTSHRVAQLTSRDRE